MISLLPIGIDGVLTEPRRAKGANQKGSKQGNKAFHILIVLLKVGVNKARDARRR